MSAESVPEISDLIIDHLHDDMQSLRACSITCKQWLPSSRYHLFSEVVLSPFVVDKFRKLLETTRSNIASTVRRLVLSEFNGYICWHEYIDLAAANEDLRSISGHLREVTSLRVKRSVGLDTDILSNLTGVRRLEMVDMDMISMGDTFGLVHGVLEQLQTLSMENISWDTQVRNVRRYMQWQPSFALGTLRLEGTAFIDVTNWLLAFKPMPAVHTLHCNALDATTSESRDALLQAVGPSVHSLHVHLEYRPMDRTDAHLIDISACTNLRALYLMEILTDMCMAHFRMDIISQIASHKLEEIVLDLSTSNSKSYWMDSFDWAGMADILTGPQFANLRQLLIDCRFRADSFSMERLIDTETERSISTGALSDMHRRGILQFIHTDA